MKLARLANKFTNYIYFLSRYKSHSTAYHFAHYKFPLAFANQVKHDGEWLIFTQSQNKIKASFARRFGYEFDKLVIAFNDPELKVLEAEDDYTLISIQGIRLYIRSLSNLVTLYELYIDRIYNIHIHADKCIVVDIGMNVGYGSLLFAANPAVNKVYSYEPFESTYNEGLQNFELNVGLAQKINAYQKGVSNYAGIVEVPMMESGSGGASTNKDVLAVNGMQHLPKIEVEIISIEEIFQLIEKNHPGEAILCKIDCEGDEYPIFDYLAGSGKISLPKAYIIEWHIKGPELITEKLNQAGFQYIVLKHPTEKSGMIYAFK